MIRQGYLTFFLAKTFRTAGAGSVDFCSVGTSLVIYSRVHVIFRVYLAGHASGCTYFQFSEKNTQDFG